MKNDNIKMSLTHNMQPTISGITIFIMSPNILAKAYHKTFKKH